MKVDIQGRIERVTKIQDVVLTIVRTPAPSPYDQPGVFELRSKKSLGKAGEEFQGSVIVRGFPGRKFEYTDQETGEQRQGQNMVVHLTVDEAA